MNQAQDSSASRRCDCDQMTCSVCAEQFKADMLAMAEDCKEAGQLLSEIAGATTSRRLWYRNASSPRYHEAGSDFMRLGLASCGSRIVQPGRRPDFEAKPDELLKRNLRICQDCLKIAVRYE